MYLLMSYGRSICRVGTTYLKIRHICREKNILNLMRVGGKDNTVTVVLSPMLAKLVTSDFSKRIYILYGIERPANIIGWILNKLMFIVVQT